MYLMHSFHFDLITLTRGSLWFLFVPAHLSWGTNLFVSIQKKSSSSSFFMLWSRGIDSKEPIPLANVAWARICKRLRSPGIDFKKPIPLANVAWARICKCLRSPGIDSKEPIPLANVAWARICKRLRSPEIDSEESIPPAYETWRAGTTSRFVVPAARLGIDSGLLKRFTNTGSVVPVK